MSFALKSVTAAVASAVLLSSSASAAGLGKLTVLSALGQPLRAEIELTTAANEDPSSLAVKLAAPDAFRVANIEFNPALLSLRFAIEQRGARQFIKVSSTQPLNEPFVDMLIELSWNNGRLVREYTFLLDPAELRATQSAQVAPPVEAPPAQRARAGALPEPAAEETRRIQAEQTAAQARRILEERRAEREAAQPSRASQDAGTPARYRVKSGDTLGHIASRVKPVDVSLDMMLVALYRANPDAFIGNNMNRLKAGQILSVPDADTVRGTGEGEAHGVVVAHAADFHAYRNKLAGQVATSAPAKAPQAGQSAAGKITAKVEERATAANESQDQLRLSKALPGTATDGAGVTSTAEDAIAREKELAEAQARVLELEKNVSQLEKLMTVKSQAGAEAANKAAVKPATPAQPAPKKAAAPQEPGLADMVMDNINYIAAGLAVLALAAFGVKRRRKRTDAQAAAPAEPSILGVPTEAAHSLFAETGGQSVDTNNSVFNSSFAPSASQLDTNEVDPVAEADVYIAYGRDAQAEEILKEALRTHPERSPVRLKLLEIYATRKDQRAFETQAGELYSMTRGQGADWAQAAALGLSIDPLNPLYASASGAAPVAAAPSLEERSQQALLSQQLEEAFRGGEPRSDEPAPDASGDADATALPQAAGDQPAPKLDDDNALDFDLGGLAFEPVSSTEPIAMPGPGDKEREDATAVPDLEFDLAPLADGVPAPAAGAAAAKPEDPLDLAFDMDFDAPAAAEEKTPEDKAEAGLALDMSLGGPVTDIDMADLAKQFDLPPLPAAPGDSAPATELKDPLFDLDAMDFGLPQAPSAAAPGAAAEPQDPLFDLDTMEFDAPQAASEDAPVGARAQDADDPFALPDLPAAPAPAEPRFEFADIDLDLPPADEPATAAPEAEAAGAGALSAAHMEMETKLDLAIAYQEIGDKEGARELLEEVIKGGSSEQVIKAEAMRAKLA